MGGDDKEAEDRLSRVGRLVAAARDELAEKVGEQGIAVAVVVRTYDGTSIHAALGSPAGSDVTSADFVNYLHGAMDIYMAKLPYLMKDDPELRHWMSLERKTDEQ